MPSILIMKVIGQRSFSEKLFCFRSLSEMDTERPTEQLELPFYIEITEISRIHDQI